MDDFELPLEYVSIRDTPVISAETQQRLQDVSRILIRQSIIVTSSSLEVSYYNYTSKVVCIGNELKDKNLYRTIYNNIDYCFPFSRKDFVKTPHYLISFFHEFAHFLTIKNFFEVYRERISQQKKLRSYRKYPYEKLADNLGYALIANNHNEIFSILNGQEVTADVSKNLALVQEYKKRYID